MPGDAPCIGGVSPALPSGFGQILLMSLQPNQTQEEEFYCITWEAKKEVVFELPTGGAAIMRQVG